MRRKKKTTIVTIEASERTTIRREAGRALAWCPRCNDAVLGVTLSEAVEITRNDSRSILRRIGSGEIHLIEVRSRVALICSDSLMLVQHIVTEDEF